MTTEQYQKEMAKNIEQNTLGPNDTFRFTCKECGACCRNRTTPIMLTGLDIYRMAKGLSIDPYEVLARFTSGYVGDVSHAPVVILRERLDCSCSLLRKGKCTVHSCKPIACAAYPIGRYVNLATKESGYIRQSGGCKGAVDGRVWTLDEWLDTWGLKELDAPSLSWNLMAGMVAEVMHPIKLEHIGRDVIWALYQHMYGDYDTDREFIPQVERNTEALRQFFKANKMLK